MVAPKTGSLKTIAAVVASSVVLGFVLACASTIPEGEGTPMATLTDVQVESGGESTAVTLVGLADPIYTADYDADLRAVVVELAAVMTEGEMDRVDVYDGIIDHITTTSYMEDGGEPVTRVEIAMGIEGDFTAYESEAGLRIELGEAVGAMAADQDAEEGDPWADAEGTDVSMSEISEEPEIGLPEPPVATMLSAVEVQTLVGGALIHLKANGSIWALESSVLESPDRLVVDLLGMSAESGIKPIAVEHSMISGVRVGAHSDKTRVVVDGGVEAMGFTERSIKPSADGLFVAVGSGEEVDMALSQGLESAVATWIAKATAERDAAALELAATAEAEPEELATEDDMWAPAEGEETAEWDTDTALADDSADPLMDDSLEASEEATEWEAAEVTPVVEEPQVATALTEVHGVHYTAMDNMDRIAVLSEAPVNYTVHSPDPDTVVVSLFGSTISPQVAGRIRGEKGGPVSLVTIFEQPDVDSNEVRLVVTRAPNQKPLISRRGSLLFVDFEHLGVAAAAPPAFLEEETTGISLAAADDGADSLEEMGEEAEFAALEGAGDELVASSDAMETMLELADDAGLDGAAAMDPGFADDDLTMPVSDDEFADLSGPLDDFDSIDGSELGLEEAPASLEPPAAVEVLVEGGLTDGKQYSGRRISLDFNGVPVSDVLRLIAEVSDLNLIAGDEVKGAVTIRLVDTPWDQALDVVLLTKGLGFVRVGNILRVAPSDILAAEEELRLQERRNREKLEDLMVKLLPVNYAAVKDMSSLVKRLLSSRGTVNIDERTNTLILKDIASVLDEAVALVKAVDTETPQVMIEAKIVEANLNFSRELGSTWALTTQPVVDPFTGAVARDDLGSKNFRFHGSNGVAFSNPITSTPTALMDMGAFLLDEKLDINVALRAAESMGEGKVISSPRIVTLDNGEATIEQGVSIPFQTFEGGDAKLEFIDAVLSLKVVPHITSDRSIIMDIEVTRNAPDESVPTPTGSPAIAKAEAATETLVKDGQTLVLGGIYTIDKSERESRVPYLHRLPVIGAAFRSKELTDLRKELLIFVTPRIVKSPSLAARD